MQRCLLEAGKEDKVGHEIMEPVFLEEPGREVRGLRRSAVSGSREVCLLCALCTGEDGQHSPAGSQGSKQSPHGVTKVRTGLQSEEHSKVPG